MMFFLMYVFRFLAGFGPDMLAVAATGTQLKGTLSNKSPIM